MKIHTYHDNIGRDQSALPLVYFWKERWERQGWEAVILGRDDAQKHPQWAQLATAYDRLPTVNGKPYEFACYVRWLAMEMAGGGWMTDSDVIPYDFKPRAPTERRRPLPAVHTPRPAAGRGGAVSRARTDVQRRERLRDGLDHLQSMGVRTLWISPPFVSRQQKIDQWGAYHGYWVHDLFGIDPRFGDMAELRALADDVHARGMRLVLDMVYNHTDYESPLRKAHPEWDACSLAYDGRSLLFASKE
jgi:hypothetical protein